MSLAILSVGVASMPLATHRNNVSLTPLIAPRPLKPLTRPTRFTAPKNRIAPLPPAKTFTPPSLVRVPVPEPRIEASMAMHSPAPSAPVTAPLVLPVVLVPLPVKTDNLSQTSAPSGAQKPIVALALGGFATSETMQARATPAPGVQAGSFGSSAVAAGSQAANRQVKAAGLDTTAALSTASPVPRVRDTAVFGASEIDPPRRSAPRSPSAMSERDVWILHKPRPLYTEEARKRQIEGSVALEVLFSRSGQVRVLRVIRGLGFGLDESAIRAAEGIRYKPAEDSGVPIDSTATVRIQFQLAY